MLRALPALAAVGPGLGSHLNIQHLAVWEAMEGGAAEPRKDGRTEQLKDGTTDDRKDALQNIGFFATGLIMQVNPPPSMLAQIATNS